MDNTGLYTLQHYDPRNTNISTLIEQLFKYHLQEEPDMSYTFDDYRREDMPEILAQFLAKFSIEERIQGLSPEEILQQYKPEEVLQHYKPEERLEGLKPEERLEGLKPEERLEGLKPEERLEGLSEEEIESYLQRLRESKQGRQQPG